MATDLKPGNLVRLKRGYSKYTGIIRAENKFFSIYSNDVCLLLNLKCKLSLDEVAEILCEEKIVEVVSIALEKIEEKNK